MKGFTWKLRALALVSAAALLVVLSGCGDNGTGSGGNGGGGGSSNTGGNNTGGGGGGGSYDYVTIGGLKWMKKNLNVSTADSWCYSNDNSNCNKYGRLYTWEAAKKACQSIGWRLPTRADWNNLAAAVGGRKVYDSENAKYHDWYDAGKALKSTSGWNDNGNGTDSYGFSALPGGQHNAGGYFYGVGGSGYWWTVTEYSNGLAYARVMYVNDLMGEIYDLEVGGGYSVRCVQ